VWDREQVRNTFGYLASSIHRSPTPTQAGQARSGLGATGRRAKPSSASPQSVSKVSKSCTNPRLPGDGGRCRRGDEADPGRRIEGDRHGRKPPDALPDGPELRCDVHLADRQCDDDEGRRTPLSSYTGSYLPASPNLEPARPTLTIDCSQIAEAPVGVYETLREIPACAWMVSAAAKALAPAPAIGSLARVAPSGPLPTSLTPGCFSSSPSPALSRVTFTSPGGTWPQPM